MSHTISASSAVLSKSIPEDEAEEFVMQLREEAERTASELRKPVLAPRQTTVTEKPVRVQYDKD